LRSSSVIALFKPVRMSKVKILCLKGDTDAAIEAIQRLGLVEVVRNTDARLGAGRPHERLGEVSGMLIKFNGMLAFLGYTGAPLPMEYKSLEGLVADCKAEEELMGAVDALGKRMEEAKKRRKTLDAAADFALRLKELSFDPRLLSVKSLSFFLGRIPTHSLGELKESLYHMTDSFEFFTAKASGFESLCLLAIDRRFAADVEARLRASEFSRITDADLSQGVGAGIDSIMRESDAVAAEEAHIEAERRGVSIENGARIAGLRDMLRGEKARLEVRGRFGLTREAFSVEGWVRDDEVTGLQKALEERLEGRAIVQRIGSDEPPPTLSSIPPQLKPFSDLVEFMSVPNQREIDPTFAFALVFPVFYGMMLGDIGYGLLSLLVGVMIAWRASGIMKSIGSVLVYASLPTMMFGICYDEFFGLPHSAILGFPLYKPVLGRMESIETLLVASIALGLAHISAGLLLGFANHWSRRERKAAWGKLGWVGVEFTLVLFTLIYVLRTLDPSYSPLLAVGALSLALIYSAEGYVGLIELPSMASNIMSYTRIVAIGVSSLAIAQILNGQLAPTASDGAPIAAVKLVLLVLGHAGNLILGIFESGIQSARLNYVEFFSKFFSGGGRRFKPFSLERKMTVQGGV
jgi:V/A-type H+/Na+-transporting ATPase subunit I